MSCDLSSIHFHDAPLFVVVELTETDEVQYWVNYPIDWESNLFALRVIVFGDVVAHRVVEGEFLGAPTLLSATARKAEAMRQCVRIETNAGFREIECASVRLVEPSVEQAAIFAALRHGV